jgi:hypothetical protein
MAGFQYDPGSGATTVTGTPQAGAGPQLSLGGGGLQGGGVSRGVAPVALAESAGDRTLDAVLEIGKGILGQKLKEQQNAAFLTGVQRTMSGEALKDIVDEQPWYTQIFGPTSTAQGARAYSQIAQVDKYTADLYGDMDNLQKLTPDEVGPQVIGRMNTFLTGDDVADSAIQMKMVEAAGPFFKAHAKQHYKWQQTDMQTQVTTAMLQAGDTIQSAARGWMDGTSTEQDRNVALAGALASWQPLQGQSAQSYWEAVKTATITSMAKGNHYMAQAVWADRDGQGSLFAAAPTETQLELLNARETYEARTREKEGTLEFGAEMGRIQGLMATGQMTPDQGVQAMENVNHQFRLKTGIDGDVYDKADVAKFIASDYKAYHAAAQAAAKANAEGNKSAQTLNEQIRSTSTAFILGNAQAALDSAIPRQVVDQTVLGIVQAKAEAGQNPYDLIVKNYVGTGGGGAGYVNEPLKNNMLSGIFASSGGYTPLLDQSVAQYDEMLKLPGGKATALGYFGADNVVKLNNYKQYITNGQMAPELAWQASFGQPVNNLQTTSKAKMQEQLLKTVKSDQPGVISSFFTGQTALTKNNMGVLANATARNFDVLRRQLSVNDTEAQNQALAMAKQQVDIIGPYAYERATPEQKPLAVLIGAAPDAAGRAFADFFAQKANKQGFKLPSGSPKELPKEQKYTNLFGGTSRGNMPWDKPAGAPDFWEQWGKDSTDSITVVRGQDSVDAAGKVTAKFILMGTTEDGKIVQMGATSDELRSFYESQPYFNE